MTTRSNSTSVVSRAPGLLIARFGSGVCVYDTSANLVHVLGPDAEALLAVLPRSLTLLADNTIDAHAVSDLLSGIDALAELGIVTVDDSEVVAGMASLASNAATGLDPGAATSPTEAVPSTAVPPTSENAISEHGRPERTMSERVLPEQDPLEDATPRPVGRPHRVLDRILVFRSDDRQLLNEIDEFLSASAVPSSDSAAADVFFDVTARDDGGVDLYALDLWAFHSRDGFFVQLPGVLHDFAAQSSTSIVFHAGAVGTPDGRVVLIPGSTEHGKSTMVAALVQRGCSYMGDEMIGVISNTLHALTYPAPLALDPNSRSVLGLPQEYQGPLTDPHELTSDVRLVSGEACAITEVVLPIYSEDHPGDPVIEHLEHVEALKALLANVTNLSRIDDDEFAALCQLAERVPVTRITHGDTLVVADQIMAGPLRGSSIQHPDRVK